MFNTFQARESVAIAVPKQSIPITNYLQEPQRLVDALQDQSQIEILAKSKGNSLITFRFVLQPLSFLQLRIFPTVDLDAWSDQTGNVYLRSLSSQVKADLMGIEFPHPHFELDLKGQIYAKADQLFGDASLDVRVEVPPPVSFTPQSMLQSTGNDLLSSVLHSMKQRLLQQLIKNYSQWTESQENYQILIH